MISTQTKLERKVQAGRPKLERRFGIRRRKSELKPQQLDFLNHYLDPKSGTYGNALQSAIRAGYGPEYAQTLTSRLPRWLSDNVRRYADRFDDDLLFKRHEELLNKRDRAVISVEKNGQKIYELIDEPDTHAVSKGLDMAYKIKDTYAPEKHLGLQVQVLELGRQLAGVLQTLNGRQREG